MLIFFEGLDKTGKSTLIKEVNKAINYKHTLIDRGPISNMVYNTMLGRDTDEVDKTIFEIMFMRHLIVFVDASDSVIEKRMKESNEKLIDEKLYNTKEVRMNFNLIIKGARWLESVGYVGFNYIVIDTSNITIDEAVQKIVDKIEEEEKYYAY